MVKWLISFAYVAAIQGFFCATAFAQEVHKILDNGADGTKIVIVILGDGYTREQHESFAKDAEELVGKLLGHDFYKVNQKAFNIYRVDYWSQDSGVSHVDAPKRTALDLTFTGKWADGWIKEGKGTNIGLSWALRQVPKYDFVLAICNEEGYGGCTIGNRVLVTRSTEWPLLCHEFGHALGGLEDEYFHQGRIYSGAAFNFRNASTLADRTRVVWADSLLWNTMVPTPVFSRPPNHVGVYEGGASYEKGVYRPSLECRMISNAAPFCPVCQKLMTAALKPYTQSQARSPAVPGGVFLHYEFRVDQAGNWSLDHLSEVKGQLVQPNNYAGNKLIIESFDASGKTYAPSLSQDPFCKRAFAEKGQFEERYAIADEGHITIDVPNMSLAEAAEKKVGLRLYEIASDHRTSVERAGFPVSPTATNSGTEQAEQIQQIDAAALAKLKKDKKVDLRIKISPEALETAIRNYKTRKHL